MLHAYSVGRLREAEVLLRHLVTVEAERVLDGFDDSIVRDRNVCNGCRRCGCFPERFVRHRLRTGMINIVVLNEAALCE